MFSCFIALQVVKLFGGLVKQFGLSVQRPRALKPC